MEIQTKKNEKVIITLVINAFVSANLVFTIDDDGEQLKGLTLEQVLDYYASVDEMKLNVYGQDNAYMGMVYFIFNNGEQGLHCICDYSLKLEPYINDANAYIERMEDLIN